MFTVSAKGIYGLLSMLDLAEAYGSGPRQIKDISAIHDIPQHYLEQILVQLKKTGLVESFRGANGGYALTRPPADIALLDILSALEGKLELVAEEKKAGILAFFWEDLQKKIAKLFSMSLEDLLNEEKGRRESFTFAI